MYIKLLLERLFKDLFLENNVNYYYFWQLCAYNLYFKHKVVVFKPKLLFVLFVLAVIKNKLMFTKTVFRPFLINLMPAWIERAFTVAFDFS